MSKLSIEVYNTSIYLPNYQARIGYNTRHTIPIRDDTIQYNMVRDNTILDALIRYVYVDIEIEISRYLCMYVSIYV